MDNSLSEQINNWSWIDSKSGKYLQSESLIKHGFIHGFFTKELNNKSPKQIVSHLDPSLTVHICKQVHGSKVIEASKTFESCLEADGLISDDSNQSLWVYTADCIPILLADPINSIVGASHAGWKGLSKNILLETIKKFENLGSNKNELIIALGPSISKPNYQVDIDLVDPIYNSIFHKNENKDLSSKEKIIFLAHSGIVDYNNNSKKMLLDIRLAAVNQLYKAGIKNEQISISPLCTFSNQNLFNSWRRDKVKKVQLSFIANQTRKY